MRFLLFRLDELNQKPNVNHTFGCGQPHSTNSAISVFDKINILFKFRVRTKCQRERIFVYNKHHFTTNLLVAQFCSVQPSPLQAVAPYQNKSNAYILITDLMLAGHMRTHTVAAAGHSLQRQVLSGCNCCQQQQVGHMIHNSVDHSSAERTKRAHFSCWVE